MRVKTSLLVLVMLLCLPLAGCASEPATMDQIPVYPGAEPLEAGDHDLADKVLEAMEASAEEQSLSTKFSLYGLPEDTTWEEIAAFYEAELAGTDWTRVSQLENESEVFKGMGWGRVSGSTEQSLVINYVPRVLTEGAFLLIGLLTK